MRPKIFLFLLLSLYIVNCTLYIEAQATTRYVSPTGSSTPPYTSWETAADSIMECINISVFGDTIYVANGTYKERVDMIPGLSLIGAGMDSCVLDTRELLNLGYTITVTDSCYVSGFYIITYNVSSGNGITIYDINREFITAIVEYNKVTTGHTGIFVVSSSLGSDPAYKLINQNIINNVQIGIESSQTSPIIKENLISAYEKALVSQILSSPLYINNLIFYTAQNWLTGYTNFLSTKSVLNNNKFLGNGSGLTFYTFNDDIIENNLVISWGVGYSGIATILKNNHFENATTAIDYAVGFGAEPIVQYNNFWNNITDFENMVGDSTNIYSDPMFVNEDSLDFHLQKFSPLIDAGDPTILDKDGTRSDIGLYGGPYGEDYHYIDLAPRTPVNLSATLDSLTVGITWNKNTEADFNHYNVYRDTSNNFEIDSTNLFLSTPVANLIDILPDYVEKIYYKITAVDNQGNESEPSEEVGFILTSVDDHQETVNDYRLYQNYPNPFNPSTKISYRLKERSYVKLYIYDIKGELVSVLVNQTQEAGFYEVDFNVKRETSDVKSDLASGIYIYQIMVKNENNIPVFTDMKKMVYIK